MAIHSNNFRTEFRLHVSRFRMKYRNSRPEKNQWEAQLLVVQRHKYLSLLEKVC